MQCPNARIRHGKHSDIADHIRDSEPERQPLIGCTRMAVVRISAASKSLQKYKEKAPEGNDTNKNIIKDSKRLALIEDSAVEEENTKLDAGVGELFDN